VRPAAATTSRERGGRRQPFALLVVVARSVKRRSAAFALAVLLLEGVQGGVVGGPRPEDFAELIRGLPTLPVCQSFKSTGRNEALADQGSSKWKE